MLPYLSFVWAKKITPSECTPLTIKTDTFPERMSIHGSKHTSVSHYKSRVLRHPSIMIFMYLKGFPSSAVGVLPKFAKGFTSSFLLCSKLIRKCILRPMPVRFYWAQYSNLTLFVYLQYFVKKQHVSRIFVVGSFGDNDSFLCNIATSILAPVYFVIYFN